MTKREPIPCSIDGSTRFMKQGRVRSDPPCKNFSYPKERSGEGTLFWVFQEHIFKALCTNSRTPISRASSSMVNRGW